MSIEDNKDIIRRVIDEAWNMGNLAVIDEVVSPEYEGHDPNYPVPISGPAGFKQWLMMARTAYPDFHITIDNLAGEGSLVAMRFTMSGSNTGSLMGLPPTGRPVTFTGLAFRRFANGKMIEGQDLSDVLGMLQQLGLAPAPQTN